MIEQSEIHAAMDRIAGHVRRTPVIPLVAGDLMPDHGVTLKLEQLQHTASFKPRGAFNAMLSEPVPESGVVAASGGNHGAAVAYAASVLGHRAEIFVPEIISPAKLSLLRSLGAEVTVTGREFAEALAACETRMAESGARLIHAYDQPAVLAGQGTVGLEFEEQAPDLDTVLVAVGGGGLVGGMACWYRDRVRVIAVEAEGTSALHDALAATRPVDVAVSGLTADSLGARRIGDLGFAAAQAFVDGALLVTDDQVRAAQKILWQKLRLIAEPGGATALAALLSGIYRPEKGERVGVLVCGGNTDPARIAV
ncbi:MAG: threonine/serine dehydratase [Alphaproteobacteria bacterium]